VAGVEPQTENVWRQANKYHVPRMCFVNKMDRMGADFYAALASIKDRLEAKVAVINLPIGAEADYAGIVDLVTMKAWIWQGEDLGANWEVVDIPEDMMELAEQYRQDLIDVISETDDSIAEKFLMEEEISEDEIAPLCATPRSTTVWSRWLNARRSRTRVSSRSSTLSASTCRPRWTSRR